MTAFENRRDAFALWGARFAEITPAPRGNRAMQAREWIYGCVGAIRAVLIRCAALERGGHQRKNEPSRRIVFDIAPPQSDKDGRCARSRQGH
uniref:Uncharacterized protein n=1 Tax=mine drainage metagenome TaxID=410659 RepID=E6PI18_9ZZZZ